MNIKGKHVLNADLDTVWPLLQDKEVLARISPGVSRIEEVGEDQYKAISEISIGPVRGAFEGELALTDKVVNETMTMTLTQKSKIGNAEAKIVMNLTPHEGEKTEVSYNGSAKVSGKLATMGQRILGGVISTLSKQVFKELEKIIEEREAAVATATVEVSSIPAEPVVDTTTAKEAAMSQATDSVQETIETHKTAIKEKLSESAVQSEQPEIRKSFIQKLLDTISSLWR